jgi:hypothetical protein
MTSINDFGDVLEKKSDSPHGFVPHRRGSIIPSSSFALYIFMPLLERCIYALHFYTLHSSH